MRDAVEGGERLDDRVKLFARRARRREGRDDLDVVFAFVLSNVLDRIRGGFEPLDQNVPNGVAPLAVTRTS